MIYAPQAGIAPWLLELRNAATGGIVQASLAAALDFVQRQPRDWQYYAGVFSGATVAAAGTPGASLAFWAAAEALDLIVFKSTEGQGFDVFVDGVAAGSIVTTSVNGAWEQVRVWLGEGEGRRRVEFVASAHPSGTNWMSFASIQPMTATTDGAPFGDGNPAPIEERTNFAEGRPWTLTFTFKAKNRTAKTTMYLPYYADIDQVRAHAAAIVLAISRVSSAGIPSVSLSRDLDVPVIDAAPGANVGRRAKFALSSWRSKAKVRITIPAFDESKTYPHEKEPGVYERRADKNDPDVAALLDLFVEPWQPAGTLSHMMTDARGSTLHLADPIVIDWVD